MTNGEQILRVPDADLDYDEDLNFTYRSRPFTGISYEEVPNYGLSELTYQEGLQSGWARDWYISGSLRSESFFYENALHGPVREFDENGDLRKQSEYEYGVLMRSSTFDLSGEVSESYQLDVDSAEFALVVRYRSQRNWPRPPV